MTPEVREALESGKPIILPTETVYGLAARADMRTAIDGIYALKGRDNSKPLALCVADTAMAGEYVELTPRLRAVMAAFWPGPLTIVAPVLKVKTLDERLIGPGGTVGLRCPQTLWLPQIKWPLALTSANISGGPDPVTFADAYSAFSQGISGIDGGACGAGVASTVVSISDNEIVILREGLITEAEIRKCLS